ncbi:MAG: hypothetical protein JW889_10050 [Verrucomicrobia bacterium]|nr:hypothetical protein [Verrucomicrobiota bacterium]
MNKSTSNTLDVLSAERLQAFAVGLAGIAPEEARKLKILYIKNALTEFKAARESMKAFGCVTAVFWIIPVFWPILIAQKRSVRLGERMFRERIQNALDVWRDDLEGAKFDLDELYQSWQ